MARSVFWSSWLLCVLAAVPSFAQTLPGSRIAFVSTRDGLGQIFTMATDGSGQTRTITDLARTRRGPVISPDGAHLAYTEHWLEGAVPKSQMVVSNADGSNPMAIEGPRVGGPTWAPNSATLMFSRQDDYESPYPYSLYRMNSNGSNRAQVTFWLEDYEPAWSPVGQRVAWTSHRDGDNDIYAVNIFNTANLVNLSHNAGIDDSAPAWSPDALQIVFVSNRHGNPEIYRMDANGSNVVRLTNDAAADADPVFSYDGQKIYFASHRTGNWEIFSMALDGSQLTNLTNNPADDTEPNNGVPVSGIPSITSGLPISMSRSSGGFATIATVSDSATPAGSLVVTATSVPAGVTVTGITNEDGTIRAVVNGSCDAVPGDYRIVLQVSDGTLTSTADLELTLLGDQAVPQNMYPDAATVFLGSTTVVPTVQFTDRFWTLTATSPTFGGTLITYPGLDVIGVAGAQPIGSHVITVTAEHPCHTSSSSDAFTLVVSACAQDAGPLVPDGREHFATVAAGATALFPVPVNAGRSYSAEVLRRDGGMFAGTLGVLDAHAECGPGGVVSSRDTASIGPGVAGARRSFSAASFEAGWYRLRLTNPEATPVDLVLRVPETTSYSAAWSTNSTYATYYSLQNTTDATINFQIVLVDTNGNSSTTMMAGAIPPGRSAQTNTLVAGVPGGRTGSAWLSHDGPPGAILPLAVIADFHALPAYVQPVKFEAVRER